MKKFTFLLFLSFLIGCVSAADAKKHNVESLKTPEIIGEIENHKVYHYEIYAKYGDSYVTHHVYYVNGKETMTSNYNNNKHNYASVTINGVEYVPVQAEINQ